MSQNPPAGPNPAHPMLRREPLPWEHPRPVEEESLAAVRLDAVMRHPAHREADRDVEFLHTDATRGVRLQEAIVE